jgi:hypothetical protein
MRNISPVYILLGGVGLLILLLNERARFAAALIVFIVIVVAAAQVFAVDLRFWK